MIIIVIIIVIVIKSKEKIKCGHVYEKRTHDIPMQITLNISNFQIPWKV